MSEVDYAENPNQLLGSPCVLVLDCSAGMAAVMSSGRTGLEYLKDAITTLLERVRKSTDSELDGAQIAIVKVSDGSARLVESWTDVRTLTPLSLEAVGDRRMVEGVQLGFELIESLCIKMRSAGISHRAPAICVISSERVCTSNNQLSQVSESFRRVRHSQKVRLLLVGDQSPEAMKESMGLSYPLAGVDIANLVWLSSQQVREKQAFDLAAEGQRQWERHDLIGAAQKYEEAVGILHSLDLWFVEYCDVAEDLGHIYREMNEYQRAIECYKDARWGGTRLIGDVYFEDLKDFSAAKTIFRRIAFSRHQGDRADAAVRLSNISRFDGGNAGNGDALGWIYFALADCPHRTDLIQAKDLLEANSTIEQVEQARRLSAEWLQQSADALEVMMGPWKDVGL